MSGSIMKLLHPFAKGRQRAQQSRSRAGWPGHKRPGWSAAGRGTWPSPAACTSAGVCRSFSSTALELVAAFPVLRHALHLLERPAQLAPLDRLPQRRRSAEVSRGPTARCPARSAACRPRPRTNRSISCRRPAFMRMNGRKRVHVGVDGKGSAEENLLNRRAHLVQADPAAC